ncbi:hypothetical protein Hte_007909 [Hypoxylon texense]
MDHHWKSQVRERDAAIQRQSRIIHDLHKEIAKLKEAPENVNHKLDQLKRTHLELEREIVRLRSTVAERESHIVNLIPSQRQFTTDEATTEYKNLDDNIDEWVELWAGRIVGSDELQAQSIKYARRNSVDINTFSGWLRKWPYLFGVILVPDMNQDVLIAFIWRWLQESIFSTILCSTIPDVAKVIDGIAVSMDEYINPKPSLYVTRTWRSQAYLTLVEHPVIKKHRNKTVHELSKQLATMLGFMRLDADESKFIRSISENIVEPALALHEKFLTSIRDFNLHYDPNFRAGERFGGEYSHLEGVDCHDIARNRRKLDVDKLILRPSIEEFRENLQTAGFDSY